MLDEKLERFKCILFWRFQYIKRQALKVYDESWEDVVDNVLSWQDDEYGSDTHRYVTYALGSKIQLGGSSYDLGKVPEDLLPYFSAYYLISAQYGYFLADIIEEMSALDDLRFIVKEGTTPLPPVPFVKNDPWESFVLKAVTILIHQGHFKSAGGDPSVNEELDLVARNSMREMNAFASASECCTDDLERVSRVNRFSLREWVVEEYAKGLKGDFLDESRAVKLITAFNKIDSASFQITSNVSRASGLYLWDCKDNKSKQSDVIREIRDVLGAERNSDDSEFYTWASQTNTCIEAGKVRSVSRSN